MPDRPNVLIRMQHNTAVIVLGMHRSGTSALAGMLDILGVQFGKSLLEAGADNPKGFWEHLEILDIHERLLALLGSSWDDPRPLPASWWLSDPVQPFHAEIVRVLRRDFERVPVWGLKEPRTCRLIPLWRDILKELGCRTCFVLIYRHPLEVAQSLERRNGFGRAKSASLWLDHNIRLEEWTRGNRRVFVSYDRLLSDPEKCLNEITRATGNVLPPCTGDTLGRINHFLTPDLRHHDDNPGLVTDEFGHYGPWLNTVYDARTLACRDPNGSVLARFDKLKQDYDAAIAACEPAIADHVSDLQGRVCHLNGQLDDRQEQMDRLLTSVSWRATRPLRGAARVLRHAFSNTGPN